MIVYTNNGYPSLTADGKVRTCCCGCASFEYTVLFTYADGYVLEPWGDHTIYDRIVAGATGCGALYESVTRDTLQNVAAAAWSKEGCDGPCGESYTQKRASYVDGRFRYPYKTTPMSLAADVGYECNRFYSGELGPTWARFELSRLVVSGIGQNVLHVRYRRAGQNPGTFPVMDVSADGTYADTGGITANLGGTAGTNESIYVEFYFT